MATKQRKGAYIAGGEMRVPKAAKTRRAAAEAMKAGITKANPASHKANLEANEASHEIGAAKDDWAHIKDLEKDAAYEAIMDKGRSRKAKRAKAATKDDYAHIRKLADDAAYQAKQRREGK